MDPHHTSNNSNRSLTSPTHLINQWRVLKLKTSPNIQDLLLNLKVLLLISHNLFLLPRLKVNPLKNHHRLTKKFIFLFMEALVTKMTFKTSRFNPNRVLNWCLRTRSHQLDLMEEHLTMTNSKAIHWESLKSPHKTHINVLLTGYQYLKWTTSTIRSISSTIQRTRSSFDPTIKQHHL